MASIPVFIGFIISRIISISLTTTIDEMLTIAFLCNDLMWGNNIKYGRFLKIIIQWVILMFKCITLTYYKKIELVLMFYFV